MHAAMLFVPGSDERKLDKIPALPARAFLLDLEDGVAPSAKPAAREFIPAAVRRHGDGRHLWVRVNPVNSDDFYDDVHAVVVPGVEGINVPKVERARDLEVAAWLIAELERRRGLPPGRVRLMATLETARGVHDAEAIAASTDRLDALVFGAADYSRDVGLDWPPAGGPSLTVLAAKARLVQASAARGLHAPHDGASAEFRDLDALRAEADAARALGFGGKHAIHPAQLGVIEAAFRPTGAQLEWARRVVTEFDRHARDGTGAFALDGKMIDAPVAARARAVLAAADEAAS